MKKSTIIYCSIIAILFVSVLYLLYLNFNKAPVINTFIPKSEVIPTPDPTADWQTYENKIHGFSFKYPSNYISTYEDDRKMTSSYLTTIHSSDYGVNKEELAYTYGTAFYYVDIKNNQCSEIKNLVSTTPTFKLINTGGLRNTIIFEIYDKLSSRFPSREALVSVNNKCIEMYCNSTKQGCTDNELGKEFTQILSTFKFTNSATSIWQTYKNSQYGFEFQYPSNFLVEQNASEITVWDNKNKPTRPLQDNWPGKFFTIKYETIIQPFSISNWLAVHESFSEFKQVDKDETKLWLGEYVTKKIGSNEFFLFRTDGPGANDGYILVNSELLLYFSSPEGDELFTDQTFNQTLSTFKFTN